MEEERGARSWVVARALKDRLVGLKDRQVGASHMEEVRGARSWGATRALSTQKSLCTPHGGGGVRSWVVARALEARQVGAKYMVEASGARSWGAVRALSTRRVGA